MFFDDKRHSLIDRFIQREIGAEVYENLESNYRSFNIAVKVKSGFRVYVLFYDYFIDEEGNVYVVSVKRFNSKSISSFFNARGKEQANVFEQDICDFIYEKINDMIDADLKNINKEDLKPYDDYAEYEVFKRITL
ncbi:hypothetical protein E1N66_21665 [Pantoea allii]|nr:hypothetical protein [Pantoea allii]THB82312.1 hypothetical protein E1N66_21665 [Pantoea allii]